MRSWLIAVSAVGVLAVGVVAAEGQRRSSTGPHASPGAIAATVTWVSDGDTLRARAADGTDLGRVRLLGIDAPELAHDGRSAQGWSEQARAALGALTPVGAAITLVPDLGQADRDVYGRLLRYVEIGGADAATSCWLRAPLESRRCPMAWRHPSAPARMPRPRPGRRANTWACGAHAPECRHPHPLKGAVMSHNDEYDWTKGMKSQPTALDLDGQECVALVRELRRAAGDREAVGFSFAEVYADLSGDPEYAYSPSAQDRYVEAALAAHARYELRGAALAGPFYELAERIERSGRVDLDDPSSRALVVDMLDDTGWQLDEPWAAPPAEMHRVMEAVARPVSQPDPLAETHETQAHEYAPDNRAAGQTREFSDPVSEAARRRMDQHRARVGGAATTGIQTAPHR